MKPYIAQHSSPGVPLVMWPTVNLTFTHVPMVNLIVLAFLCYSINFRRIKFPWHFTDLCGFFSVLNKKPRTCQHLAQTLTTEYHGTWTSEHPGENPASFLTPIVGRSPWGHHDVFSHGAAFSPVLLVLSIVIPLSLKMPLTMNYDLI